MKYNDLKIGTKMYSGFIFVTLLALIIGIIGYVDISKIVYQLNISKKVNSIIVDTDDTQAGSLRYIIYGDEKYHELVDTETKHIKNQATEVKNLLLSSDNKRAADEIYSAISKYEQDNENYRNLSLEREKVHEHWVNSAMLANEQIAQVIDDAKKYLKTHKSDYTSVEQLLMLLEARNEFNNVRITANQYLKTPTKELETKLQNEITEIKQIYSNASVAVVSGYSKQIMTAATKSIEDYNAQFNLYKDILEKQEQIQANQRTNSEALLTAARGLRDGVYDFINKTKSTAVAQLILFIVLALIAGIVIGTIITRNITRPLKKSVQFANTISQGDLTQVLDIQQRDEVGILADSMKNMLQRLKDIVMSVMSGSDNIASASQEMSNTAMSMSQGNNEQASSVEEISSTMEEIAANIQQNTDNAQQTEDISTIARSGIEDVRKNSQAAIKANKQIAEKITIINDIAFQTNILALNAAVEAARAGDNGKGFAVVAAEVRKLAERSKIAADEIVKLAKDSLDQSELTGRKMDEILPEVVKTAQLVQEISAASKEQNNGAVQVNNAIQQLNNVTQQSAASSEELSTSAEEMAGQAEQLRELIKFFTIDVRDNSGTNIQDHISTESDLLHTNNGNGANGKENVKLNGKLNGKVRNNGHSVGAKRNGQVIDLNNKFKHTKMDDSFESF